MILRTNMRQKDFSIAVLIGGGGGGQHPLTSIRSCLMSSEKITEDRGSEQKQEVRYHKLLC